MTDSLAQSFVDLSIDPAHPAYAGHFPGTPILPGVVLLDAALYALTARHGNSSDQPLQLKSAKFLSPVLPGESLTLYYRESAVANFRFEIRCGERMVASGLATSIGPGSK